MVRISLLLCSDKGLWYYITKCCVCMNSIEMCACIISILLMTAYNNVDVLMILFACMYVGQFWNTPADLLPSSESDIYRVMIHSMTSGVREFQGDLHPLTWDFQYKPCLYGGDRQGFPVLEGKYKDYKVSGDIFNTDFTFSQFSSTHCQN